MAVSLEASMDTVRQIGVLQEWSGLEHLEMSMAGTSSEVRSQDKPEPHILVEPMFAVQEPGHVATVLALRSMVTVHPRVLLSQACELARRQEDQQRLEVQSRGDLQVRHHGCGGVGTSAEHGQRLGYAPRRSVCAQ